MRLGVILDDLEFAALAEQARAVERAGLDFAWLETTPRTGPPLLTAAALAPLTRTLRIVAHVDGDAHPLAIAEAAAVADNCLNGRLILSLPPGETADAVRLALTARPFAFAGERWTIPANRPENDGASARITVTPPPAQLALPVWTALPAADELRRLDGGDPARLAQRLRPRLVLDELPSGLAAYWASELGDA